MNIWSISFSYRLGLAFHALNNEGAEGSNLMQPRRIDVGKATYDGISGEMVRRHILENFVNLCNEQQPPIPVLPLSQALHPDRGPLGIRQKARQLGVTKLTRRNPADLYNATREAIVSCAVLDVGGFLAPFAEKPEAETTGAQAKAPEAAIEGTLAELGGREEGAPYTVKRDSVFDVAWLVSEKRQDLAITQHAAYRPSGTQSLFSQTMRSNTYGGVIRADLHRIGTDDYWYLQPGTNGDNLVSRLALGPGEQRRRQRALVQAIVNFIASPTGAKVAGWAPHVFLTEGAVLLTSSRTAPFVSPLKVDLADPDAPIAFNVGYSEAMKSLANDTDSWFWSFNDAKGLLDALKCVEQQLPETKGGTDAQNEEKTDG
jgi:CRISPR-associated protein Cst2